MRDRTELIALCIARGGYRQGAQVAEFINEWEVAVRKQAGPISVRYFARHWRDSESTAYRRLRDFRSMFPELGEQGTPQDLMRPLLERLEAEGNLGTNWQELDRVQLVLP